MSLRVVLFLLLATISTLAKPQYGSINNQNQVLTTQNECRTEYQTLTEVVYDEIEEDICQNTYKTKCESVPRRKCTPNRQQKCQNINVQECNTRQEQQCNDVYREVNQPYTDSECWEEAQDCQKVWVDLGYGMKEWRDDPDCPFHYEVHNFKKVVQRGSARVYNCV